MYKFGCIKFEIHLDLIFSQVGVINATVEQQVAYAHGADVQGKTPHHNMQTM